MRNCGALGKLYALRLHVDSSEYIQYIHLRMDEVHIFLVIAGCSTAFLKIYCRLLPGVFHFESMSCFKVGHQQQSTHFLLPYESHMFRRSVHHFLYVRISQRVPCVSVARKANGKSIPSTACTDQ